MRTWILGLLLAVLPLQFVWASVASYCQHDADIVADHIGHHEHQHAAGADTGDAPDLDPVTPESSLGTVDADCSFCHLSCAQPLTAHADSWFEQTSHKIVSNAPLRYATRSPESLERPQWHRLACSASLEEMRIT